MFRSAASLIAKKTAIVAITGVTVIGGATFALAVEGDPSGTEASPSIEITTLEECQAASGTWDAVAETCTLPDTTPTTPQEDCETASGTWDTVTETCTPADTTPTTPQEDCETASGTWDTVTETCTPADTEGDEGAGEDAVHPENHGKYVSEAAKGGGDCAGLSGRDRGQCVSGVARSDAGKKAAEAPTGPLLNEDESSDSSSDLTESQNVDEPKAEKAPKGNAGGNGKGKKP